MTKKEIRHYVVCNLNYAITSTLIKTKLYSKVITNIIEHYYNKRIKHYWFDLERWLKCINSCMTLPSLLLTAFPWDKTPEGDEYWTDIYRRYRNYNILF